MSPEKILAIGVVGFVLVFGLIILLVRMPHKPKQRQFVRKWRELQKLCGNKDTWPLAVIRADSLVDEAMKKMKVSGKTTGERLVSAEKVFTDNDAVWYAHKLRNKLAHNEAVKLTDAMVKRALVGFRQALKDLGAL